MVVVPAVAEREQRNPEVVAALVTALVALRTVAVPEGVYREGHVVEDNRAHEEAPHDEFETADGEESDSEHERWQHREAIDEAQLRIAREVADQGEVGLAVAAAQQPAHVRPPEATAR